MSNYTEHITKLQAETLATIKQAQDASLATFASLRDFASSYPTTFAKLPTIEGAPKPSDVVEQSYAFAGQLLELQKAYALKVAEMIASAQKQAVDTTVRTAKSGKSE